MAPNAHRISRTAARWMIAGEWRAYPGRVIVAIIAIAVGVGLGFAVHLINASALTEFARAVRTVNGDADLQVHAKTALGFDEGLYPKLARLEGIAAASPVVEMTASSGNAAMTLLGLDVLRAGVATPSLVGHRSAGDGGPFEENALYLSDAALRATAKHIGDSVEVTARGRTLPFTIAGTLPAAGDGDFIGVIDIAAAQWRFDILGRLQRIDLRLADGAEPSRMRDAIATLLPQDAEIVDRESEARRTDNLSSAYRVNLDMLALVALLTGGFLVFSAQALSVTRRRAQFALLRVLGAEPRALLAQLLAEGTVVGTIGSLLGLALGFGLADVALQVFGGDLGSGYFRGTRPHLVFATVPALTFFALGLVAAIGGSLVPAIDAARAKPAIALKNSGDHADPKTTPKAWTALILLTLGVAAAFAPAAGGVPVLGYISIGLLLAGGVAAMPLIARGLLAPLQRLALRAPAIGLALKRLWGAPSQAAIALSGIVASTSLMIAMAVMVTSFRGSVDEWLTQLLPADVYLHLEGDDGGLGPELQRTLGAAPGVRTADFRKVTPLRLAASRPPVTILAREDPGGTLPMIGATAPVPEGATRVYVSEPAAELYRYRPGDWIELPFTGAPAKVFVAGIFRDYARQQGAIAIDNADYTRLTGDALRTDGAVTLAAGTELRAVIDAMRAALPPSIAARMTFASPRELRATSLDIFDRSFAITYVLEAIAILVGLAGVAATVSAQTLVRTKEFGMLRHIGVTKGQIAAMLVTEGALLGAIGVIAGIGLGLAMSQVLIHVVNPQSFHWSMETRLPLPLFAVVAGTLVLAAAGTAFAAGQRALSTDAVRAVREDW